MSDVGETSVAVISDEEVLLAWCKYMRGVSGVRSIPAGDHRGRGPYCVDIVGQWHNLSAAAKVRRETRWNLGDIPISRD